MRSRHGTAQSPVIETAHQLAVLNALARCALVRGLG
jgi:hypothetical protein